MEAIQHLHKILRPFLLRRTKKDLATQLPDKIEINVNVEMPALQIELYISLLKQ
jgi:ATP-dependent helicase STH1/SNF2